MKSTILLQNVYKFEISVVMSHSMRMREKVTRLITQSTNGVQGSTLIDDSCCIIEIQCVTCDIRLSCLLRLYINL